MLQRNHFRRNEFKNLIILLLTATIWGVAFVAQSVGMEYIGPFTFNCVRSIIGGIVLIPCMFFLRYLRKTGDKEKMYSEKNEKDEKKEPLLNKEAIIGGICCGIVLCVASNFQQIGIMYTTVGKAGFITALYVVFVPICGLFLRKKVNVIIWGSVILSVIGLYLLCMTESFSLGKGDMLVLISALAFTVHILVIDYFSPKVDGVVMSCVQFLVSGIISGIIMFFVEKPDLRNIIAAWAPILYAGVLSCGVAYTLQIVGQKGINPTVASLILCLESVISAVAGWIILGEALTIREIAGCALMFGAIVLAQIPVKVKNSC